MFSPHFDLSKSRIMELGSPMKVRTENILFDIDNIKVLIVYAFTIVVMMRDHLKMRETTVNKVNN